MTRPFLPWTTQLCCSIITSRIAHDRELHRPSIHGPSLGQERAVLSHASVPNVYALPLCCFSHFGEHQRCTTARNSVLSTVPLLREWSKTRGARIALSSTGTDVAHRCNGALSRAWVSHSQTLHPGFRLPTRRPAWRLRLSIHDQRFRCAEHCWIFGGGTLS